jgi:hypothetical protein
MDLVARVRRGIDTIARRRYGGCLRLDAMTARLKSLVLLAALAVA